MDTYFRQRWLDERLRFSGVSEMAVHISMLQKIWKPDTYFLNGKDSYLHMITEPNKLLRINPDGTILFSMRSLVIPVYITIYMVFKKTNAHSLRRHNSAIVRHKSRAFPTQLNIQKWIAYTTKPRPVETLNANSDLLNTILCLLSILRIAFASRGFRVPGFRIWNSLPASLRSSESFPHFCSYLKTPIFCEISA